MPQQQPMQRIIARRGKLASPLQARPTPMNFVIRNHFAIGHESVKSRAHICLVPFNFPSSFPHVQFYSEHKKDDWFYSYGTYTCFLKLSSQSCHIWEQVTNYNFFVPRNKICYFRIKFGGLEDELGLFSHSLQEQIKSGIKVLWVWRQDMNFRMNENYLGRRRSILCGGREIATGDGITSYQRFR